MLPCTLVIRACKSFTHSAILCSWNDRQQTLPNAIGSFLRIPRIHFGSARCFQSPAPERELAHGSKDLERPLNDRERIKELCDAGLNVKDVAKATNNKPLFVWKYLYDEGMLSKFTYSVTSYWTDQDHVRLAELWHRGVSMLEIAKQLKRPYNSISTYVASASSRNEEGGRVIYTLQERDIARNLKKQGRTRHEIAQELKRPVRPVVHMLRASTTKKHATWEEIEKVFQFKETSLPWSEVTQRLGSERTMREWMCLYGKRIYAKKGRTGSHSGPWTEQEERKLKRLRNDLGLSYAEIARRLPGRSPNAIGQKYTKLDGSVDALALTKYTTEEREKILRLRAEGRIWKEIGLQLPGRSINGIQQFYYRTIHETMNNDRNVPRNVPASEGALAVT